MKLFITLGLVMLSSLSINAQFSDQFEGDHVDDSWDYFTGDGFAEIEFTTRDGIAQIKVDATNDPFNVWWAIIKRNIAPDVDLELLSKPGYELRVEARVKIRNAPKRLNFMINTQRTTDFHEHLREYDIATNNEWYIISMTTKNLDVKPGDDLNVQLSVTDWGPDIYLVDLDYYKATVVKTDEASDDVGEPLVYHPPVEPLSTFKYKLSASEASAVNKNFPELNFLNWAMGDEQLLTVTSDQWVILKWNLSGLGTKITAGPSILELTTESFQKGGNYTDVFGEDLGIEFGKVRIIEILGGNEDWKSETVSYQNLTEGASYEEVFNTQMIFDTEVTEEPGGKTYVTLSRPVTQRLLDGTTRGLLIRPLGAVVASFRTGEEPPLLYLNLSEN